MAEPIFISISGHQDVLSPKTFISAVKNFWDFLRDLDSAVTGDPQGTVYWQISHLSKNSPAKVAFQGQSRLSTQDYVSEIEIECIEGVKAINEHGERRDRYSDSAINRVLKLARLHTMRNVKERVDEIRIGLDGKSTEIGRITIDRIEELRSARYYSEGSIVGDLDSITIHRGNEFRVWEEITGHPVTCRFPEDKIEDVKKVLGNRVLVYGQIQANNKGQSTSVIVEGIEPYPDETELPTIDEMSGLITNITGGMSLENYVEEIRSG